MNQTRFTYLYSTLYIKKDSDRLRSHIFYYIDDGDGEKRPNQLALTVREN